MQNDDGETQIMYGEMHGGDVKCSEVLIASNQATTASKERTASNQATTASN